MFGLELKGITKRFAGGVRNAGSPVALDDVDLSVPEGAFVSLVGPSGCGKSTLLKIVAGLVEQDAGEVWLDGRRVDALSPKARDMAMVFQTYALYPHLTAFENIAVPLRMRHLPLLARLPGIGRWVRRRADEKAIVADVHAAASLLGIEGLLGRKPGQLSGGQRQRVAIGRAIVRRPRVFLMDEPLSNLDAALRVQMRLELADLHRRLGATFLYVTHDQAEAMTLSQRLAVMFEGRVLQFDTPSRIYDAPAHVRVARFVGSPEINLLSGRVAADGWIETGSVNHPLGASLPPKSKVTVGVRPEALELMPASQGVATLAGCVVHLENLGSEVLVGVELDEPATRVVVRIHPYRQTPPALGARVNVRPDLERCHVFDEAGWRQEPGTTASAERERSYA